MQVLLYPRSSECQVQRKNLHYLPVILHDKTNFLLRSWFVCDWSNSNVNMSNVLKHHFDELAINGLFHTSASLFSFVYYLCYFIRYTPLRFSAFAFPSYFRNSLGFSVTKCKFIFISSVTSVCGFSRLPDHLKFFQGLSVVLWLLKFYGITTLNKFQICCNGAAHFFKQTLLNNNGWSTTLIITCTL